MYRKLLFSKFLFSNIIKKNKLFTISIIGQQNAGKSTLFNALKGEYVSLVDSIPGLTRDRKEIETDFMDTRIKLVDTAGVDTLDDKQFLKAIKNFNDFSNDKLKNMSAEEEKIMKLCIFQTKNALIYSDLVIFLLDGRKGFTNADKNISDWILKNLSKEEIERRKNLIRSKNREDSIIENDNRNNIENKNKCDNNYKLENDKITCEIKANSTDLKLDENIEKNTLSNIENEDKMETDTFNNENQFFESIKKNKTNEKIKIPDILLVANKIEDGYIPYELYNESKKIPKIFNFPILISSKNGDGMTDLYKEINDRIPEEYRNKQKDLAQKRLERFNAYKQKLKDEFISNNTELSYSVSNWEKDFNHYNDKNIEENSDFDSDNDIDPIDTLINPIQKEDIKKSGKHGIAIESKENLRLYKKPIKVALIGQTNVGKSSIINSMLKENRVIVSDVAGTTRDVIPIEWIYKGRRVELIDTAGLVNNPNFKSTDKIESLISKKTINTINNSHVIIYVFDAFKAMDHLDFSILNYIGKEGRSVVLIANKFDLIPNGYKIKAKSWISQQIDKHCTEFKNPKICFTSVKLNMKIPSIMEEVFKVYNSWNSRIPTKSLNAFSIQLNKIAKRPNMDGEYLNLKFITQVKVRPPSFVLFLNDIDLFFKSHENFVKKMICKEFGLVNVPMRFIIRDGKVDTNNLDNDFKKKSVSTVKIEKKVATQKTKLKNITYLRKSKGHELLHGRTRPRSIRE